LGAGRTVAFIRSSTVSNPLVSPREPACRAPHCSRVIVVRLRGCLPGPNSLSVRSVIRWSGGFLRSAEIKAPPTLDSRIGAEKEARA